MSFDKMNQYRDEKKKRSQGGYKSAREKSTYKRDTVAMVIVLLVLFLAPIGITVYSQHQAKIQESEQAEVLKMLQDSLASASEATASEAESGTAEGSTAETKAAEKDAVQQSQAAAVPSQTEAE